MERRAFVKSGALALVTMGLSPSFLRRTAFGMELRHAPKGKVLVCLFQRGAADGLNVIVPHGEKAYYAMRPSIAIPQPLRTLAHTSSLTLSRWQREAVDRAGGVTVPLAQLLAHDFLTQPDTLFGRDHYHPSSAGYVAACTVLLPALCSALHDGSSSSTANPAFEGS